MRDAVFDGRKAGALNESKIIVNVCVRVQEKLIYDNCLRRDPDPAQKKRI